MLKVDVLNLSGKKVGDLELSENVFGIEVNEIAVHSAIVNYLADQRQGTQSTKTRSEVSGGGRKPWKQKGTGRARQGSIRAPQWIKGGIALGPKPRSYTYSIPKKVKALALKSVLTSKLQEGKLVVVDDLDLGEIKTKKMVEALTKLNSLNSLVVIEKKNVNVQASAKNIENVKASVVDSINTYDILTHEKLVISKEAIKKIEEVYA